LRNSAAAVRQTPKTMKNAIDRRRLPDVIRQA
jgi:hypothetical protein